MFQLEEINNTIVSMKWDEDVEWVPAGKTPEATSSPLPNCDESEDLDREVRRTLVRRPDDDLSPNPPLLLRGPSRPQLSKRNMAQVDDDGIPQGDGEGNDDDADGCGFVDTGKEFLATKAFLGAIYPPSVYIRPGKDTFDNMDETFNNWSEPEISLELDFVMGYRARDSRCNLHWITDKQVVFPVAAVGVVFEMTRKDEEFFFGHTDDIVSLDLHKADPSREGDIDLVASGSIGAQRECQLCIWEPQSKELKHNITGFLQFGVVSVGFNPSGSLVCAVGLDEHHSVAVFSVATGLLLAHCAADKNRVLQGRFARCSNVNCEETFVTIGVSHICFWSGSGVAGKGSNYFLTTSEPLDRRLSWQRGFGIENIDHIALMALDFTEAHTVVGGTDGIVYLMDTAKHSVVARVAVGDGPEKIYQILTLRGPIADRTPLRQRVAVATQQGMMSFWDVTTSDDLVGVSMSESKSATADGSRVNMNIVDKATNNDKSYMVNSIRSISWLETPGLMAIGTILSSVYSLKVDTWTNGGAPPGKLRTLMTGHFGDLHDANAYGEVWGVDIHPFEQKVYTCGDDCTVRLWDLDTALEVRRKYVKYLAYKVSVDHSAQLVAVGHRNGGVTVLSGDLNTILVPFSRDDRTRTIADVQFSPNGKMLALASAQSIYVYDVAVVKDDVTGTSSYALKLVGACRGHTSFIDSVDWNLESSLLQSVSRGYELLYHSVPDCVMVTGVKAIADELWYSQTCTIGWGVQGIWPRYADGTDINSLAKSRSQKWLVTTDDWGRVKLFNYPCLGSGFDRKTGRLNLRPQFKEYRGHSSHVTNCAWTFDDTYVVSTGGADLTLFSWKVVYNNVPRPEFFLNSASTGVVRHNRKGGLAYVAPNDTVLESGESELLSVCYMCQYSYPQSTPDGDAALKHCPRCNAPRLRPTKASKLRKAWTGASESRFMLPTQSFAKYTREQQELRRQNSEMQSMRPEVVWKAGNVKVVEVVHGASSDEEEIAKKLRGVKKTIVADAPPPPSSSAPVKKTKPKKTAGPDFRDY